MLSIRSLVEEPGVFGRNKVPLKLKILDLAFYIRLSSLRKTARALSEKRKVSKTAVWKCVRRLNEKVNTRPFRMLEGHSVR